MSKSWIFIIVMSAAMLLGVVGYELYLSSTGTNVQFNKTAPQIIPADLGEKELMYISSLEQNIIVEDKSLDNK